jgi:hypothetical protein
MLKNVLPTLEAGVMFNAFHGFSPYFNEVVLRRQSRRIFVPFRIS